MPAAVKRLLLGPAGAPRGGEGSAGDSRSGGLGLMRERGRVGDGKEWAREQYRAIDGFSAASKAKPQQTRLGD